VNLAYALARRGWNTLPLADTDPQGIGGTLALEKARKCQGILRCREHRDQCAPFDPHHRLPNDLPAAEPIVSGNTADAVDTLGSLRRIIAELSTQPYDLIIDTPATADRQLRGCLAAHPDHVLIPQQAEPLGIAAFLKFSRPSGFTDRSSVAGILMTMVQQDRKESTGWCGNFRPLVPCCFFARPSFPGSGVSESVRAGVPLGAAAPSGGGPCVRPVGRRGCFSCSSNPDP
jgi:cellulose biosynthesis protein BcsQ